MFLQEREENEVNALMALAILALLWPVAALRAAVTKTTWSDAPAREFVFVENNSDDNFFVTPGGALDPRMTGANRWTGLKIHRLRDHLSAESRLYR